MKKYLTSIFAVLLSLLLVLSFAACAKADGESTDTGSAAGTTETPQNLEVRGEGSRVFVFEVTTDDGTTKYEIHTDETVVGKALLDLGLIEGTNETYGLYVKKVNGVEADFDKDGTYWAFYVDGSYAMSGVDQTDIEEGKVYSFVKTKG